MASLARVSPCSHLKAPTLRLSGEYLYNISELMPEVSAASEQNMDRQLQGQIIVFRCFYHDFFPFLLLGNKFVHGFS